MGTEAARRESPAIRDYALLAALIACVYGGSLLVGFFIDDLQTLENAQRSGWGVRDLSRAFTVFDPENIEAWGLDHTATRFFRPLLMASFKLDHALFGLAAAGFHLTNLLLHFLNCCMLFWLLSRFGLPLRRARLGACLFAVFCHNGVAVVWISGRTELLLATFMLASVLFYARALTSRRPGDHLLALGFAACALLTKESAVALPAYLLGADWILSGNGEERLSARLARAGARLVPVIALTCAFLVFRLGFWGPLDPPPRPYYFDPTAPGFLPFLGIKTLYYLFAWVTTVPIMPVAAVAFLAAHPLLLLAMGAFVALALTLVVRALRGERQLGGLLLWMVACQVPVAMVMASSHYLYMGNAAAAAIIAMLLMRGAALGRRARIATVLVFALFVGHNLYTLIGYYRLAHLNADATAAVAEVGEEDLDDADLYLINLHFIGAHVGQRLRVLHGVRGLRAHLLSVSSKPFAIGRAPEYSWRDDRTLVLRFEEGLISSELLEMLAQMGADLTPGRRHRAGPAWVEPHGPAEGEIDELVVELDEPPDGSGILVVMFRVSGEGDAEAVRLTPRGERSVTFADGAGIE